MMRKYLLILIVAFLYFSFTLPKSAQKKIDKTIAAVWKNEVITKQVVNLSETQKKQISFNFKNDNLYKLLNNNKLVGFLFLSRTRGKSDFFDYMIIFKPDLSILIIKLLIYREEYGGEIGSTRWLKQFIGKTNAKEIKFGDDIQNISGATISAKSITFDIKKSTKKLHELRLKGII